MPSSIQRVEVEGLKELEDALQNRLTRATAKNTIRKALIRAAQPLIDTATVLIKVRRIPEPIRVSKIRFAKGSAGRRAFADAMSRGASREEAGEAAHAANAKAKADGDDDPTITSGSMSIGPTRAAFYGFEFGTKYIAPSPFMRPAWDQHKNEVLDLIVVTLMEEIEKASKRAAAKAARIAAKI